MAQIRQLAVIMFTDIVGYTALMGNDEAKALIYLDQNRQIQKPIISAHNGRWIKELGDGVMASFTTVSDAVNAAIEIQRTCANTAEFRLRIGIHLGEVVVENEDVFGDGVNIAARIQTVAHPGSIFVSEPVYNNIRNKQNIETSYVTTVPLKNVRDPMPIYQVIAEGVIIAPTQRKKSRIHVPRGVLFIFLTAVLVLTAGYFLMPLKAGKNSYLDEKTIAVLPFEDMSPEKDQEYLSDGLAEEIINSISIINDLKVIGRTSTFQFKGKDLNAQVIGRQLDAGIVLEGSVQKWGDHLRIITKLIRVRDNSTIWSRRFDEQLKDIFAIQDTIAANIVENLKITLTESERPRLFKKETDPDVYALYLKGLHTYKDQDYKESIDYNLQAIAKDSLFAPSYAYIALSKIWLIYRTDAFGDIHAIGEAKRFAKKSIELDPDLAEGYSALGLLAWSIELDFASAKEHFEKSITLNPSASLISNRYAYFLLWMGEFSKAEALGRNAISADPADFNGYVIVATSCIYQSKSEEAEQFISEGKKLFPNLFTFKQLAVQNAFLAVEYTKVIEMTQALQEEHPDLPLLLLSDLSLAYLKNGDSKASEKILYQLRKIHDNEDLSKMYCIARIYAQYGMRDSCFTYLEKSFLKKESALKLLKIDRMLEPVRQDPRYLNLFQRYGFDKYR